MIPALLPVIGAALEKLLPDPAAAAEAKLRMLELAQKGELAQLDAEVRLALGQVDVNKIEAATDVFRGGWRPACGWACSFGLAYDFLLRPILPWVISLSGRQVSPLPSIDMDSLLVLLGGLLGLGSLRTIERIRGKI